MYFKNKAIEDIIKQPVFKGDDILLISRKSRNILVYRIKDYSLKWSSHEKDYGCSVFKDEIFTTNLKAYDINGEVVFRHGNYHDYFFTAVDYASMEQSIWKTIDEEIEEVRYHIFNLNDKCFDFSNLKLKGVFFFYTEKYLTSYDSGNIYIYTKSDFNMLWQMDLREELKYHHDGKEIIGTIKQIKVFQDNLIVISDGGVVRISIDNGEVLWHTKGYTTNIEIVGNIGYAYTNAALSKINLVTGERTGYGWEYHALPDISWKDRNYSFIGTGGVYHEGMLWFSVFSSGESFVVAINPKNGLYEWIHHVDTYEQIDRPVFYKDKMFILDTGGTLHIYQKE